MVQQVEPYVAVRFDDLKLFIEQSDIQSSCNLDFISSLPNTRKNSVKIGKIKAAKRCVQIPKNYFPAQYLKILNMGSFEDFEDIDAAVG